MEEMTTDEQKYLSLDEVLGGYMDEQFLMEDAVVPDAPILPEVVKNHIQNPPFIQQMLQKISDVDTYAWNRGQMGFDFGFDCLNKAFNGMNTGLMLIAGGANSGKSALLLKILWNVARKNKFISEDHPKMAFSLYFSLDDLGLKLSSSQDQTFLRGKYLSKETHEKLLVLISELSIITSVLPLYL